MLLICLDPYLLGDPLFLSQLARDLAHRGGGALLVHGSGEAGERAIEATGALARQRDGVWDVDTPELTAEVERATRELNRQIVHELNEAGVSAIRVIGADRGLLKRINGEVVAGHTDWLSGLVRRGVVAVVATLVDAAGDALPEVDPVVGASALARALGVESVVLIASGSTTEREAHDAAWIETLRSRGMRAERVRRDQIRSIPSG